MARRPRRPTAAELDLFHRTMKGVKPLRGKAPAPAPGPTPAPSPTPAPPAPAPETPAPPRLTVRHAPPPLPELGHGDMPGLDRRSQQRLTRGRMTIDGRIDLHGMTQDQAHGALNHFILRGVDRGWRCVLVITGKGTTRGGVLRGAVPDWLNMPPVRRWILGFHYAQPRDGGQGALYVLLRRRRDG